MKKYLLIALALVACAPSFAQTKAGSAQPKGKAIPCTHGIHVISATEGYSRCGRGSLNLTATAPGGTLSWYAAATGGKSLGTGPSFTTPAISSTTIYYVAVSDGGCMSKRAAVTATVLAPPATPVIRVSGSTDLCEGQSIQLSVTTAAPSMLWSTGVTNSVITTDRAADYTVTVTDARGCSATSAPVKTSVNPYPFITSITPGQRCGAGQMPLNATASAGMVKWYKSPTDTAAISYGTLYFTPYYIVPRKDTFYVDATYRGCTSRRMSIPAAVHIPSIASTTPGSRSDAGAVLLKAIPKSGVVSWYANPAGGVSLGADSLFTTPSLTATKTYYAQASSGGCVSERKAVLAEVKSASASTVQEAASTRSILYMYPNPNSGSFTLLSNTEGSYTILDEKGNAIRTVQLNRDNNYTVSNQSLGGGTYFVVGGNDNQTRQKLVVAK